MVVEHICCCRYDSSVARLAVDPGAYGGYEEGHEGVQVLPVGVGVCVDCAASVDQQVGCAIVVYAVLVNERLVDQVVALVGRVGGYGRHRSRGLTPVVSRNPSMHPYRHPSAGSDTYSAVL